VNCGYRFPRGSPTVATILLRTKVLLLMHTGEDRYRIRLHPIDESPAVDEYLSD
jgi:hypothetical protein